MLLKCSNCDTYFQWILQYGECVGCGFTVEVCEEEE
jgi:formate hydrogenlyase subunit 6/NADH:ubiquinone oxidoreductase subunit I